MTIYNPDIYLICDVNLMYELLSVSICFNLNKKKRHKCYHYIYGMIYY